MKRGKLTDFYKKVKRFRRLDDLHFNEKKRIDAEREYKGVMDTKASEEYPLMNAQKLVLDVHARLNRKLRNREEYAEIASELRDALWFAESAEDYSSGRPVYDVDENERRQVFKSIEGAAKKALRQRSRITLGENFGWDNMMKGVQKDARAHYETNKRRYAASVFLIGGLVLTAFSFYLSPTGFSVANQTNLSSGNLFFTLGLVLTAIAGTYLYLKRK